jgi:hypothetical protein
MISNIFKSEMSHVVKERFLNSQSLFGWMGTRRGMLNAQYIPEFRPDKTLRRINFACAVNMKEVGDLCGEAGKLPPSVLTAWLAELENARLAVTQPVMQET